VTLRASSFDPVSCSQYEAKHVRGCEPWDLPPPHPDITEEEYQRAMYRAFNCLVENVVVPYIECPLNSSQTSSQQQLAQSVVRRRLGPLAERKGCNAGDLHDYGTNPGDGWRALAQRAFCILEERLYETRHYCGEFHGRDGLYVNEPHV